MSMTLARSPLLSIGMNGAGMQKRRSARLSGEGAEDVEPPAKKSRGNGVQTTTVSTKEVDGEAAIAPKKKKVVYDESNDDFSFAKRKKAKATKTPAVRTSTVEKAPSPAKAPPPAPPVESAPLPEPAEDPAPKTAQKKPKKRLPTTPERDAADKQSVRRRTQLPKENEASPHKPSHAKSHANHDRSPSPFRARPLTVEKKRKAAEGGVEERPIMRIALPLADTPINKRNKEMRKTSAENGSRRSSGGLRGRRASSLIDEGRGNALPHTEVPTAEFYKHISADLTEPRRMRCLLGWCGMRALPPKPEPPKESTSAANLEFQARQAARVIQEELCQDLITKGILSDWFSRDDDAPQVPLRKKPNPRNVANAAKAAELESELERLKKQKAEWDELSASAVPKASPSKAKTKVGETEDNLSPINPDLLEPPQRDILTQLQAPASASAPPVDAGAIQQRLRNISENLEFTVDQFAHGVHALSTTRDVGERLADKTLDQAAVVLTEREKARNVDGKAVDTMDALRGLARVLNGRTR